MIILFIVTINSAPTSSLIDSITILINGEGEVSSSIARSKGSYKSIQYVTIDGPSSLLEYAFSGFESMKTIAVSTTVKEIGNYCFSGCSSLTEFEFPESVETVASYLFENCKKLSKVIISSTVSTILDRFLYGCTAMKSFEVSGDSECFSTDSTGSFFLSKDGTILYSSNAEKIQTVPKTVKVLHSYCFINLAYTSIDFSSSKLETIRSYSIWLLTISLLVFPSTLKKVESNSFYQSTITKISFPSSITSFHTKSLNQIRKLESVTAENGTTLLSINGLIVDYNIKIIHFVNPVENVSIPPSIETVLTAGILSADVQNVNVEDGNEKYFSYDGALYLKSGNILQACPGGKKSLRFHSSCKSTASESFLYGNIETIEVNEGFEDFGMHCFGSCKNLRSINFPSSLKTIYSWCFNFCSNLKIDIVLGSKIERICEYSLGNTGINSINLSKCIKLIKIEQYVFRNNIMTSVVLPSNLVQINTYSFVNSSIREIVFPSTLKTLQTGCFLSCLSLTKVDFSNSTLTSIPDSCFEDTSIASIEIPSSVVSLGSRCFSGCIKLVSITFQPYSSLTTLYPSFIYGCEKLTEFDIGFNLTNINDGAFAGCLGIKEFSKSNHKYSAMNGLLVEVSSMSVIAVPGAKKSVVIGKEIRSINILAFSGCTKLISVSFEEDSLITELSGSIFENCVGLTSVTFSNSLVQFDSSLFKGCTELQYVDFIGNSSLKIVNEGTFKNFTSLQAFGFQNCLQLEEVSSSAFEGCINLKSIDLQRVKYIRQRAFFGCAKLTSVRLPPTVETVAQSVFESCTNLHTFRCCSIEVTASDCLAKSGVSFVYVPFDFPSNLFGVLPVFKGLDIDCQIATPRFTNNADSVSVVAPVFGLVYDE